MLYSDILAAEKLCLQWYIHMSFYNHSVLDERNQKPATTFVLQYPLVNVDLTHRKTSLPESVTLYQILPHFLTHAPLHLSGLPQSPELLHQSGCKSLYLTFPLL